MRGNLKIAQLPRRAIWRSAQFGDSFRDRARDAHFVDLRILEIVAVLESNGDLRTLAIRAVSPK